MTTDKRIEVYIDGACPLCQWMRSRVEPFDKKNRIDWLDYRQPQTLERAAPHTFHELNREMHVQTSSGWAKGYYGWIEIIRVLPFWRWLALLMSLWPFTWFGPKLYRWLARRRYSLFGVPPPCDQDGVCSLHS